MTLRLRTMTTSDIPAGMRLKDLAGWNQTPSAWTRFLEANPDDCFVAEVDGQVCGTATSIVYEDRFAWIGMVLVDPAFRGHGIGTRLLEKEIEHLDARRVPTLKLDATPQGKPIYEKLGFVAEYEIERWLLRRSPGTAPAVTNSPRATLDRILPWDHEIFGADRSALLGSLERDAPEFTLIVEGKNDLAGYALGRRGSRADHLGPWVASDERSARQLLEDFLRRSRRELIFVDCLKGNSPAREMLREHDFEMSRPLTRMYRGPNPHPGLPDLVCAILGPEFG